MSVRRIGVDLNVRVFGNNHDNQRESYPRNYYYIHHISTYKVKRRVTRTRPTNKRDDQITISYA